MKISGCIALVTGGASGIGRGICELLLQHGAKVAVVDVNGERGQEVERTFGEKYGTGCIKFIRCDVSVESDLKEAFLAVISLWGQIDIVCNNAGVLDEDNWSKTLKTNLHAVIQSTFLGVELMKEGVIINLSSTGGIHPVSFCPVYCASKFGVIGFTRSVAPTVFRKNGIRVNCVCPGATDTDIFKSMERMELTKEQQELASNTPKQKPEVVAQCVVDLIKDESHFGQVVKVTYEDGVEFLNFSDIVI